MSDAGHLLTNDTPNWLLNGTLSGTTNTMIDAATLENNSYEHEFSQTSKTTLTVLITMVTLLGLVGNTMVILIVAIYSDMHTLVNFSFANLALTDLTLLLLDGIPTAVDTIGLNVSAKLGCAIPIYLQYVVAEVTSLTLAFLSWDRYRLIVKPLQSLSTRSSKQIYLIMFLIWIASFVIQIPTAFVPAVSPETGCNEFGQPWGESLFFTYATVTLYIIPLIVIIPCYTGIAISMTKKTSATQNEDSKRLAQRKKTIKWVFIVVLFYILMWLPIHVVHMWMAFDPVVTSQTPLYIELHTVANVLMFINSSVNPYLYTLAGPSFRMHLKSIAYCCCCGLLVRRKTKECLSRSETSGSTWM
ncbi:mesotocin receptor-like [Amphiura filiformis]|uniref:mesotocin receptor-like n=1 Tax=Amphiura filiformis TaxID=82378 RepID=UPI003B21A58B